MAKDRKTRSEYIIDTLLSGKPRRSAEIARMISEAMGEEVKIVDVSSVLGKLSNSDNYNLGYFIKKTKSTGTSFKFRLVPEVLELATEEIYNLTRNFGRDFLSLNEAIRKVPNLKKYVPAEKLNLPPRGPGRRRNVPVSFSVGEVLAVLGQEIARQGGLKVNFNLTVQLEETGGQYNENQGGQNEQAHDKRQNIFAGRGGLEPASF